MRSSNSDLNVTWQEVEEGRANVVARWIGSGGGKNLMFNGHMDTSNTGTEEFLAGPGYKPHAIVKNGFYLRPRHLQHERCARLLHPCREGLAARW